MVRQSRKEARLARATEDKLRQSEKSARLRERPVTERVPRAGANPNSIFQMHMTWTLEGADLTGSWASGASRGWTTDQWEITVAPKLAEWGQLTWAEIDSLSTSNGHKMHHAMPIEVLSDDARERLQELKNTSEMLFRFRLGNRPRLWGRRVVAEFRILWFDPEHEVYPVEPE